MDAERRYMEEKRKKDFYKEAAQVWESVFYCDECSQSIHACLDHSAKIMDLDQRAKDL